MAHPEIFLHELLCCTIKVVEPSQCRIAVVSGCIHNAVLRCVVLRKILALSRRVKSKLQYLHSGICRLLEKFSHRRSDYSKILRYDTALSCFSLNDIEQIVFRTIVPLAAVCGLAAERYGIVAVETDEVVYTDNIIQLLCEAHSADPPAIVFLLHSVPVVDGVSPQLPVLRESVRRESRNDGRHSVTVKLKQLRFAPDIRTVKGAVYRNITDNLYPVVICVLLQLVPLTEELELKECVEFHILCVLLLCGIYRRYVTQAKRRFPLAPAFTAVCVL